MQSGQRLGSIAKRYNVTVDALCNANGIKKTDTIRPGQKLIVPGRDDRDGSDARAQNPALAKQQKSATRKSNDAPNRQQASGTLPSADRVHRVESGQRLGSIAKRYNVTVDALCEANGIKKTATIRPGQLLTIPERPDQAGGGSDAGGAPTPESGKKTTSKPGHLELYTWTSRWRGQVIDRKGRLSPSAVAAISRLLGATGNRPRLDTRLIRVLVQVSDAFGSKPIRVVSGYRASSFYDDSRHRQSRAIDFSIPGVPNTTLRDYLRRLRNVGVGYYPNSSFVHLDVREGAAYWVDYAGPGEAPRSKPYVPKTSVARNDEGTAKDDAKTKDNPKSSATNGVDAHASSTGSNGAEAAGASGDGPTQKASLRIAPRGLKNTKQPARQGAAPSEPPLL